MRRTRLASAGGQVRVPRVLPRPREQAAAPATGGATRRPLRGADLGDGDPAPGPGGHPFQRSTAPGFEPGGPSREWRSAPARRDDTTATPRGPRRGMPQGNEPEHVPRVLVAQGNGGNTDEASARLGAL